MVKNKPYGEIQYTDYVRKKEIEIRIENFELRLKLRVPF